jgi:hypothetical protein
VLGSEKVFAVAVFRVVMHRTPIVLEIFSLIKCAFYSPIFGDVDISKCDISAKNRKMT